MLQRRLTFPAAGIALVLSFILTGLGIWAGNVIVSIMSNQLIEQMTEAVRREVDDMITFGDRMSTRMVNDLARYPPKSRGRSGQNLEREQSRQRGRLSGAAT